MNVSFGLLYAAEVAREAMHAVEQAQYNPKELSVDRVASQGDGPAEPSEDQPAPSGMYMERMQKALSTIGLAQEPNDVQRQVGMEAAAESVRDQRDGLSELGEQQQLRMQMLMERMSKADSAASNVMRKFSEAHSAIVQNLK